MVGSREGTYSHIDYYGDSIVNITLKEPIKLEVYMYMLMRDAFSCLMRDEKEGRKKQARSNKQQGKATQHTQGCHFS